MSVFKNIYQGKKVLVTGSTGFKGSWLSTWLLNLGAEVSGYALDPLHDIDNFNVCHLDKDIDQHISDIRDFEKVNRWITDQNPDFIFHLAAQPLVLESYKNPLYTFETNFMGTCNVLEAARNAPNLQAAVIITSDKCYENIETERGYTETDALGGADPYSASKGAAEIAFSAFMRSYYNSDDTPNIASARAGNVIGGGDWSDNRLIPDIFKSIQNNETVDIRNPHATRPWEHVLEPISGYLLLGALLSESDQYCGSWNFGPETDEHFSVGDVIQELAKVNNKLKFQLANIENAPHEAGLLQLDITKASQQLGWLPQMDFTETIAFTNDGYEIQLNQGDIRAHRLQQIEAYIAMAKSNNSDWAQ